MDRFNLEESIDQELDQEFLGLLFIREKDKYFTASTQTHWLRQFKQGCRISFNTCLFLLPHLQMPCSLPDLR